MSSNLKKRGSSRFLALIKRSGGEQKSMILKNLLKFFGPNLMCICGGYILLSQSGLNYLCVTAAGNFTVWPRGFPLFRRIWNYGYTHGVCKTLTSCQQNPILFGRAGLTTPTRLGFLFWLTFSVTSRHNGNYDSNTKRKGHRYGSND